MNFLFPSFLYALSAVSIPIIIHLFNFRRYKKVYFSNVLFLQEAIQESRSRSKVKHWLVLLCRILAIAFLALAFAQPYFPAKHGIQVAGSKCVSVFIDNSFSMNSLTSGGSLLEEAKKEAIQVAKPLNPSDKVQLVSQDFDDAQERWLNKDEFIAEVKALKTSPDSRTIADIIKRQQENLIHSGCPSKECFLFSDFQKSFTYLSPDLGQNTISTYLLPIVSESSKNISADTCWFNSPLHLPRKSEILNVRINNYSADAVQDAPIKLFINGEVKAVGSYNIAPNSFSIVTLSFIPSIGTNQQGLIKINDYPITFDDELFFSFKITTHIPILRIHPENSSSDNYLQNLYGRDSLFVYREVTDTHIDYASLTTYRLIILDGLPSIESGMTNELKSYVQQGGTVLIIPPDNDLQTEKYKEALSSLKCGWYQNMDTTHLKADWLNLESPIFKTVFTGKRRPNMDLPQIFRHYVISPTERTESETLIRLENGGALLEQFHNGKGLIYMLAVPLSNEYSTLQKHAIFVPTFYNVALYSMPALPLYYTLGDMYPIEAPNITLPQNNFFKIVSEHGNSDSMPVSVLPERRVIDNSVFLYLHQQLSQAGNYNLFAGDSMISGCSFNYNRKESEMSFVSPTELKKQCTDAGLTNFTVMQVTNTSISGLMQEVNRGTYLWKYCILLALMFLAAEELLLRFLT